MRDTRPLWVMRKKHPSLLTVHKSRSAAWDGMTGRGGFTLVCATEREESTQAREWYQEWCQEWYERMVSEIGIRR